MKFHVLNRKVHYWAAAVVAAPCLVVLVTGLLLQLKKQLPWVQPPTKRGVGREPTLSMARLLDVCRSVPQAEIASWQDVERVDVRPEHGVYKVRGHSGWEVQVDGQTGEVLHVAYRRSDLIEALHDGSWFHPAAKLWLFLPAAVVLLLMWATGMYLFVLPIYVRWRSRRARRAQQEALTASRP